jgi:hypothetical protein
MSVTRYLLRRHAPIYIIWWSIMFTTLVLLVASLQIFGPWIVDADYASAWSLAVNAAPGWFFFVIGILLAGTYLPVGIAHGITRRDFVISAGLFGLISAGLFELMKVIGLLLEALAYNIFGIMDKITEPFPWPTLGGALIDVLKYLGFLSSGWLVALVFYRLRIWWALLLTPFATIPLSAGMEFSSYVPQWWAVVAIVAVSGVASYLAVRGLAVKPKKA